MNAEFLKGVLLFQGLDNDQLAEILMLGIVKDYKKGAAIFEEGAEGDRLYVIYTGAVRISRMYEHMGEEALTVLGPGEFLGEMSFFNAEPRSARAIAQEDVQLLELHNADLRNGDVLRFLSKKNDVWFPKLKPVPVMGTEKENHTSWERYYRVSDC